MTRVPKQHQFGLVQVSKAINKVGTREQEASKRIRRQLIDNCGAVLRGKRAIGRGVGTASMARRRLTAWLD